MVLPVMSVVLLQAKELLTSDQQGKLLKQALQTFVKTAQVDTMHANWLPAFGEAWNGSDKLLLQLCHGLPGMMIALANL